MAIGKLTHAAIAKINKPGMRGDGAGLWAMIARLQDQSLSKRWVFRYRRSGKYYEIPIGKFPDTSLADARVRASEFRAALARGENPAAERKATIRGTAYSSSAPSAYTFKDAALDYAEMARRRWRKPETAEDWVRGLRLHLFPALGDVPVNALTDTAVQAALTPIFARSPDQGRRIVEHAAVAFDRARAMRYTDKPNPFTWKSYLALIFPPKPPTQHRAAIPWQDVPAIYDALVARGDHPAALGARFCLALALRPGECRGARFDMISEADATLTLNVTKNGKPFVVPLNGAALAVIERCREYRHGDYLFAGRNGMKPVNETALLEEIRRLCHELFGVHATVHGVARSCFAEWAYTSEAASPATIEAALNHSIGSATVKAYMRSDLLPLRRVLMDRYSDFLSGANVIALPLHRQSATP